VSVHYNSWGDYPNSDGYTTKKIHVYFEGGFVRQNLKREAVAAAVAPYGDCKSSFDQKARELLLASLSQVVPFYALEKDGGFKKGGRRGVDFATAPLALGALFARVMVYDAWVASADGMVGYSDRREANLGFRRSCHRFAAATPPHRKIRRSSRTRRVSA
jgi:hypothetical protein